MSKNMKRGVAKKSEISEIIWMHSFSSPLGKIELLSNAKGVCRISLPGQKVNVEDMVQLSSNSVTVKIGGAENRKASKQLNEYFQGKRRTFSFKIDLQLNGFYRKALLQGVSKIPYGQTQSYGEVARMVGSPRGARAVGTANSTNPLPFVIPCHRVVASNGLGGYGGGLPMKRKLLRLESQGLKS